MPRLCSVLCLLLAVSPAFAQQSVAEAAAQSRAAAETRKAAAAPPSREDVLKLFDLLQITKTMDAVIKATKQQSMELAEQMLREKMPDISPAQKKQFEEMIDEVMQTALGPGAMKEMLEATIPVYQKHLTKADLDAMIAFYSSPVGKRSCRSSRPWCRRAWKLRRESSRELRAPCSRRSTSALQRWLKPGKSRQRNRNVRPYSRQKRTFKGTR